MATPTLATMTADELLAMPHDSYRFELIKGALHQMAPASSQHGRIALRIGWRLAQFVEREGLGETYAAETGFVIATAPDTVRAPDASFVSKERTVLASDEGFFPGAPDLAIEVVSPSDRPVEVEDKARDWLRAGTRMVIVIDPFDRTAVIYRGLDDILTLTASDTIDGGDVVPGWTLPLADVF